MTIRLECRGHRHVMRFGRFECYCGKYNGSVIRTYGLDDKDYLVQPVLHLDGEDDEIPDLPLTGPVV